MPACPLGYDPDSSCTSDHLRLVHLYVPAARQCAEALLLLLRCCCCCMHALQILQLYSICVPNQDPFMFCSIASIETMPASLQQ
jgi:hypothetical protein